MSVDLVRIDDRLIHGQVVVGWARALGIDRIVLVDDAVRSSTWMQELYQLSVPPELQLAFASVDEAAGAVAQWARDPQHTLVLLPDVATAVRLLDGAGAITELNVGGVHQAAGRSARLPYVYLSDEEVEQLRHIAARGVRVTAQDVPTARRVELQDFA